MDGYPGVNNDALLLWGSLAIGLVGGLISVFLYRVGLTLLGLLAGFTLAVWILSLKSGGLITNETGRAIFIGCLALVVAILIHFFEKVIIILASSMGGSYSIIYGIDTFAQ